MVPTFLTFYNFQFEAIGSKISLQKKPWKIFSRFFIKTPIFSLNYQKKTNKKKTEKLRIWEKVKFFRAENALYRKSRCLSDFFLNIDGYYLDILHCRCQRYGYQTYNRFHTALHFSLSKARSFILESFW